ncbi:MAG TPA: NDP-sugar synthase [Acidimicrobiales bacterium]|nr:NDP-sugar synthase [Acidimicrobiales bacterium]
MRAVVLVGGSGTRLRPLTLALPKQMLPVAEVPMIHRVLAHLAAHGVNEAVLSLGYRHEAFLDAMPRARDLGLRVTPVIETEPLGTGGAVGFAARTAGIDERFVAVNGDVLTDLDLGALVDFHAQRGAEATLALTPVDDASPFGLVATEDDGRVCAFVEKPATAQPGVVNAGMYVFEPSVVDRIPKDRPVSIERETFPAICAEGRLYAMVSSSYFADTGTPERFLRCQLDLLTGRRPGPPAPGAHDRGDGVWTIGSAVVDGEVQGPALIGTAAYVQAGASVERSVVGAGARVLEGARVQDSVLLPGAVVRADATVELCLVGEQAVVGEKASLSGFTVVGPNVEVEPGAHLHGARRPADD